ncbi:MAG: copper resistance protein CopC [Acidobacteriota bacterium]
MRRAPIVVAVLACSTLARAHVRLEKSAPAAGETLAAPPAFVQLWFEGTVEVRYCKIAVSGPDKKAVRTGKLEALDEGASLRTTLEPGLPPGAYHVAYDVLSADGHKLQGGFDFAIGSTAR